jgi:hypothetical protein
MSDERTRDRIAAWQAAGLIDAGTADRLRTYELAAISGPEKPAPRAALASLLGPAVSVGEMLAYLGGAFLLAAWQVFTNAPATEFGAPEDFGRRVIQFGVPAVVLALVGVYRRRGDERRSRAAGVSFATATAYAAVAIGSLIEVLAPAIDTVPMLALAGLFVTILALGFRRLHPAVLTQLTLLLALWGFAATSLAWLDQRIYPRTEAFDFSDPPLDSGMAVLRVALTAGWWLAWAVALGVIGLVEARSALSAPDERRAAEADRRATASRFIAGLVAVSGTALAVTQTNGSERVLPVWLGDLAILAVAAALVVFAFRRASSAYLYPAAIGLIGALSDLNARYIASSSGTAVALLVEGVILLAAGFAADRLRRRVGRADDDATVMPVPAGPTPIPGS